MRSREDSPKSRTKGFRSSIRDFFRRSSSPLSSRPPSPQLPQLQGSTPAGTLGDARSVSGRRHEPNVSSPNQRPTVGQTSSVPFTISAEHTNPQPSPAQSDTHIPLSPKNEATVADMAWAGFRTSLQTLKEASGVFGPLASAAGVLLECFDTIETAAKNRQGYEDLATDIATMSETLARHFSGSASMSTSMQECISGISQGIEQQANQIKGKQDHGTGRQLVLAKENEDDVVRRSRRVQSLFRQLEVNVNMSNWSMTHEEVVRKRLKALDPNRQAAYDSKLSDSINRRTCTEGTRKTVLSDLTSWLQDPKTPAVCWMNGMAGTGKTTIACTLAEWLEREHLLAASFFCTRTSIDCRDVTRIIPTIAYQLARMLLMKPLLKAKAGSSQAKSTISDRLVVVVDALDECDDQAGVERLLDVLFRHAPDLPLKFFVTSRPEPEIYEKMSMNAQRREAVYLHDVEKSLVRADIQLYLTQELASMSPSPSDIEQLADRSGSLFIYAATLVRYIQPLNRRADPHKRLRSMLNLTTGTIKGHAQIDKLYIAVLNSALNQEGLEPEETEDIRMVLLTVLYAQEPIGIETIASLCNIDEPRRVEYALRSLRSVLHESGVTGLVSTLHASFPDFMFDRNRSGSYCGDIAEYGHFLAMRCFLVMKAQLRFNMCDLESSFVPDDKVQNLENRMKEKISPALAYTCRYWANHLPLTPISQNLVDRLIDFLSMRLLSWMEVMTLRRVTAMGIDALVKAKQWLMNSNTASPNLAVWLEDAIAFVTSYAANPASLSTPHIYISALPFCPRSSLVHKHYWNRMQGLLELKGSLMERRDAAPQVHWTVGPRVYSVAYSPDGSRVAAGCYDGTVSIRSAHDGTSLVAPLQGHTGIVWSVSFSPDSKLLASGSSDYTIRVWSGSTGALFAGPFWGHTSYVYPVPFSPDSKRIVSGSTDKTIRVWDATDGTLLLGPLEGHDGSVYSVSFSPNGSLIASASSDNTIRLWQSHDGSPFGSPFQGHTDAVQSIAFTPDGNRLVSGSDDETIRVWNVSDGSAVGRPFEGHTSTIRSVAVSPDGTRVASGSYDGTVRVWKIEDGTLIAGPLSGNTSSAVYSVAFSPDGTRVIAGSAQGIQVWNVREGVLPPMLSSLEDVFRKMKSVKFSSDGSSILSCSHDNTVRIWDRSDGSFTADPDQASFDTSGFSDTSPDGSYILGESEEGKVQIMHTADGSLAAGPFEVYHNSLRAFRFSHDSRSVIMGCRDGTLQVQPVSGGKVPVTDFYGHHDTISSIDWSHDSSLLLSYSYMEDTIRVWHMPEPVLHFESYSESPPVPSANQAGSIVYDGWRVNEDGWVVNNNNHLLFWLPFEIARTRPSPYASLIITKNGVLIIPEQKVFIGDQWSKCYIGG